MLVVGENGKQINIRGRKLENKNDKKTKEKSEKWREINLVGSKLMASTIHKWWPILRQYYFNIDSMQVVTPYPADRPGRCWSDHLALSIEVKEHRGGASVNLKVTILDYEFDIRMNTPWSAATDTILLWRIRGRNMDSNNIFLGCLCNPLGCLGDSLWCLGNPWGIWATPCGVWVILGVSGQSPLGYLDAPLWCLDDPLGCLGDPLVCLGGPLGCLGGHLGVWATPWGVYVAPWGVWTTPWGVWLTLGVSGRPPAVSE
jgi:hypothetical protein